MRKEKSWTRQTYEATYCLMRWGQSFDWLNAQSIPTEDVLKAADYSYQAATYHVHGWSNDRRRRLFHKAMWRVLTQRGVYPF